MNPDLVQCPFNANHYVSSSSLKDHSEKCQYATILGTDIYKMDWTDLTTLRVDQHLLYQGSTVEVARVGKNVFSSDDTCRHGLT